MSQLTAIGEALNFIEDNLEENIGVADMADAAGYSLYHFCRVFNSIVHHTPYDYLMRRRLSESARAMIETDRKIIDVAFEYQFNSPETYSRAFKRMFGMPPYRWRNQGTVNERFWMPRLTLEYIQHINKGGYLTPVLVEKEALRVMGLMSLVQDRMVIPHLWEILTRELSRAESASELREYYGIAWYPRGWERDGFFYMTAVETRSLDGPHPTLVVKVIPSLTYARFVHKGPRRDLELTLDYIYHTWLPQSDMRLSHPLEIEYYGRDLSGSDHKEPEWEIYIPIK